MTAMMTIRTTRTMSRMSVRDIPSSLSPPPTMVASWEISPVTTIWKDLASWEMVKVPPVTVCPSRVKLVVPENPGSIWMENLCSPTERTYSPALFLKFSMDCPSMYSFIPL